MKRALRLFALASATVCGIAFLLDIVTLLLNYNYKHHRFLPFIVERGYITDTIWFGLSFLGFGILYLYLVRRMRPIPR
jgi:hypothetical protein